MTDDRSDAEFIAASITDPDAFESIFDRHYDAVRRYLQRRVGRDVGEELAAQTFLVAFDRRTSYDARYSSAKPWLLGIATNHLRHHLRDERTRLGAYAKAPKEPEQDQGAAEDRLVAAAAAPRIAEALMSLRPKDRDTFMLFALGELSYGDVAAALGVPLGTVRSRIHRARLRLREQLGDLVAIEGMADRR